MGKKGFALTWLRHRSDGSVERLLTRVAADGAQIGTHTTLKALHVSLTRGAVA